MNTERHSLYVIMDCQIDHNKHTFQSIDDCINYHDVMTYIDTHWKDKEHTELLETLAQDLLDFILNLPLVQTCQVIIHKPDIYNGQAIPSISIKQSKHV